MIKRCKNMTEEKNKKRMVQIKVNKNNKMNKTKAHKKIRVPFFKNFLLPRMYFFFAGFPKGSFVSVDVTKRCNLRCKHCYFFQSEHPTELSMEEWGQRFKELKKQYPFLYSSTWVGGEPMLRQDVIEKHMHLFTHNLVVTNGSIEFPDWKKVYFHVSIDGDEKSHDETRGVPGLYQKIKKNIAAAKDIKITGAMCITNLNKNSVGTVLEEFKDSNLDGFMFDFYTPMLSSPADPLCVSNNEKDEILNQLIDYKKGKYSSLIYMPVEVFESMKSSNMKKVTSTCQFRKAGLALDSGGNIKQKCMMGADADCSHCGCVVPYYLYYRKDKKQIIKSISKEVQGRIREKIQTNV
jgi:Fe-coproporphyrin III synthase